jgi:hypothetical protein
MDGSLAQVSSIHRNSALATSSTSSNGNLTIHSAANVPHADMEKLDDDPVPRQKRKKNIWTVVHTFVPA